MKGDTMNMSIPTPGTVANLHDERILNEKQRQEQERRSKATWYPLHWTELRVGDIIRLKKDGPNLDVIGINLTSDSRLLVIRTHNGKEGSISRDNVTKRPMILTYMKGRK